MAVIDLPRFPFVLDLFDAASDALAAMPTQLQPLLQQGYLDKAYQEFAEPHNQYAALADVEMFSAGIGTTFTKTRPGLKAPIQIMTDAATAADDGVLNNGITPSEGAVEQYTLTPGTYEDGMDLDLIGTNYAIVNRFGHDVKTNVIQAEQSRDLLARNTLLDGYMVGTTAITTASQALGSGGSGVNGTPQNITVQDIRGFRTTIVNGKITPVGNSATTQLSAIVFPNGSATNAYTVNIIGATADSVNATNVVFVGSGTPIGGATAAAARCNGISGTLQIAMPPSAAGKTITSADILVSNDAPKQFLAGPANLNWSQLTTSNLLTQSQLLDGKSWLEDQAMEPLEDGTFLCLGSSRSFRGLFGDADFKQAWQGLGQSPVFKKGRVSEYLGVTFLQTTNAPRIPLSGGGFAHFPMLVGKGALIDAWFEGMENWANSEFNDAFVSMGEQSHGIAQVVAKPIDRLRRKLKLSWITIRDMNAPTDVTLNSNVILTAGNSRRKRAVLLPHGSSV